MFRYAGLSSIWPRRVVVLRAVPAGRRGWALQRVARLLLLSAVCNVQDEAGFQSRSRLCRPKPSEQAKADFRLSKELVSRVPKSPSPSPNLSRFPESPSPSSNLSAIFLKAQAQALTAWHTRRTETRSTRFRKPNKKNRTHTQARL